MGKVPCRESAKCGKGKMEESVIWGKCHKEKVSYGENVIWGKCHMGKVSYCDKYHMRKVSYGGNCHMGKVIIW